MPASVQVTQNDGLVLVAEVAAPTGPQGPPGVAAPGVTVGPTPPASPTEGTLWVDTTAVPSAASGASTGTTIGLATPSLDGLSVDITIASVWGIDGSGHPYYNAAGAAPGETAILDVNAVTGEFVICQPNGVVPL